MMAERLRKKAKAYFFLKIFRQNFEDFEASAST